MVFKSFRTGVIFRAVFISCVAFSTLYLLFIEEMMLAGCLFLVLEAFLVANLIYYVENTNRKLSRFFESIRYSDFTSGFYTDNKLGESFKELNSSFNVVLDAFRETRAEKEEHLLYLNTIVQHVAVGLISFDNKGKVGLYNNAARKMLQIVHLKHIKGLQQQHPTLYRTLQELPTGGKTLLRNSNESQLTVHVIALKLRGKSVKLVSLQNIQSELEQKEIEAWQNLTKVLRHEIINSMTPIISLTETLNDILHEDLVCGDNGNCILANEPAEDLKEGLLTIKNRSKGLIRFVDDYRNFNDIPNPHFSSVSLKLLFANASNLMKPSFHNGRVTFTCDIVPEQLEIEVDEELIEMVLINLLKNALEGVKSVENPSILLRGYQDQSKRILIEVEDNGPGIVPHALKNIFIPFFTTKKGGSGIGLSLSRQIMHMHGGSISVMSVPHEKTIFTLKF